DGAGRFVVHPRLRRQGADPLDQFAIAVGEAEARAGDGTVDADGLLALQVGQLQRIAVIRYAALVEGEREAVARLRPSTDAEIELVGLSRGPRIGQPHGVAVAGLE